MIGLRLTPQEAVLSIGPEMLDEVACRRWIFTAVRGEFPECPSCCTPLDREDVDRLLNGKSITCALCGVKSSSRSGTILEGSTLTDRQVFFILALIHWDIPVYQISAMANCSPSTVYSWRNRVLANA